MRLRRSLKVVLAVSLGLLALAFLGRRRRERGTASRLAELRRAARTDRGRETAGDLEELPDPVREYLHATIDEGRPAVDSVRLEQAGRLRQNENAPWNRFTATQYVTVDPPGFLWDAAIDVAPLLSVRVRDLFADWRGAAGVSLFGVVPIDSDESSLELVEAELQRYLAEAVWYPTALLPSEGVEWEAIDASTASATIEHGDVSASLQFSFADGVVESVHTERRYRRVDDGYEPTPWTGHWDDYERRDGLLVPTSGSVVWHLPDGDFEAWQGRLTAVRYDDL
jgi:hypothetical protein